MFLFVLFCIFVLPFVFVFLSHLICQKNAVDKKTPRNFLRSECALNIILECQFGALFRSFFLDFFEQICRNGSHVQHLRLLQEFFQRTFGKETKLEE